MDSRADKIKTLVSNRTRWAEDSVSSLLKGDLVNKNKPKNKRTVFLNTSGKSFEIRNLSENELNFLLEFVCNS